jgi:hypothetical protein
MRRWPSCSDSTTIWPRSNSCTSLLMQATRAMTARGSQTDWGGRNRTRSFRRSFLMGFADRIGRRLQEATATATAAAESDFGSDLLPVLADRERRVADAVESAYPDLATMRTTSSNLAGWMQGEAAASRADLGDRPSLAS